MKSLLKMGAAALTIALTALAVNSNAFANDKQSVQSVIKQYETALNASNTGDVLKLYGNNPTFMPQHAPAQIGKDAVTAAYEAVFSSIDLDIEFVTHEIEVLGNTAWARTSSAGKTTILANNAVITEGNNELFVFKKESGSWKIHQYLFATNQPRQ